MRRLGRALAILGGVVALAALALGVAFWRAPLWFVEHGERRALVRAGLVERSLAGARGELTYFAGGSGEATVVLLHGVNDQAGAWAKVVPGLARRAHVVVPDLPGHGESAPATGPIEPSDLLAGLDAVLAAESPAEPAILVGNSMGGWLALLYARAHPQRVARVVLVNGAVLTAPPPEGLTLLPRTRTEARREVQLLFGPHAPYVPDFVLAHLARRSARAPLARMRVPPAPEFRLDGRLGEIAVPVDVVHGDEDGLLPLAYAERVADELPDARLVVLPQCGHIPQRLCPEALAASLARSLDLAAAGGDAR